MEDHMVIKGFTVVPVKFNESNTKLHYLYLNELKQHGARQEDAEKPVGRTLFIGNAPVWATKESLQQAFSHCGRVEKVSFEARPGKTNSTDEAGDGRIRLHVLPKMNHTVAYLVFNKPEAVKKAVSLPYSAPLILSTKGVPITHGLAEYKNLYLQSSARHISKEEITENIKDYDRLEKEKEDALKNAGPDEDGWITVTRIGKNKGAHRTEAEERRVKTKDARRRKKKELSNFYAFQIREGKKQKMDELRDQFMKDKSKVEQMRAQRKFRPF